ncbi:ATP-binding protein [Corynebacterium matruchotii]
MVFTPLHRELELLAMMPLDQYLLREAIRVGAREQGDLMFYETPHAIAVALARDLCALANRGGGWIFYGIRAPDGVVENLAPCQPIADIDHTVTQVARDLVTPPLVDVAVHHIPITPTGIVYAIEVPYDDQAPHHLADGTAPIRRGTTPTLECLTDAEQHQLRLEVRNFSAWRAHAIPALIDEYQRLGPIYGGATFVLAAVPTHRLLPEITTQKIERTFYDFYTTDYLEKGYDQNLIVFHFGDDPIYVDDGTLRYQDETETGSWTCSRCEITTTGIIRFAVQLGAEESPDDADVAYLGPYHQPEVFPAVSPAHVSHVELELTLLETFASVLSLQERCFNSDYDLWVGLARRREDEPVAIRRMTIHESGNRYLGEFLPVDHDSFITHPQLVSARLPLDSTVNEKRVILNRMCLGLLGQSGITSLQLIREAE